MKTINRFSSLRGLFLIVFSISSLLSVCNAITLSSTCYTSDKIAGRDVFDTVIYRIDSLIIGNIVGQDRSDLQVDSWLKKQQADGSWPNIDYKSRSMTMWAPSNHIKKLRTIAIAYTNPESKYFQQLICHQAVEKGLSYWYEEDPRSKNWFMQQISAPQCVGEILCLMYFGKEALPSTLKQKLFQRMIVIGGRPDQRGSLGSGANKMDIATHWMYRGALTHNDSVFKFGVQQMMAPISLTNGEGIQSDYSYHQHGSQLYIGGYGAVLLNHIPKLLLYLQGTEYLPKKEQVDIFTKFVYHSVVRVIRGKYYMYNVCGRSMSKKGTLNRTTDISKLRVLSIVDPEHASCYQGCIDRISLTKPASYQVSKLLTHYWRSDYTLLTSPLWNFDVRMVSTRTERHENGNGENLRGYFLSDGATCIARTGNEYEGLMPYWDWSMIPGTTAPHLAKENIPIPKPWGGLGYNQFAGGVSNGLYGLSAYSYSDTLSQVRTKAKKSYFILDDAVFCMGSDISSKSDQPLYTTINQCKPHGTCEVDKKNHSVIQDQIAYYFPNTDNWNSSIAKQEGDWHDIVRIYSSQMVSGEVFKLWINHGISPKDASYQYAIIPGIDNSSSLQDYLVHHQVEVVQCDKKAHAIIPFMNDVKLLAVAFSATSIVTSNMVVKVNHPCLLMITNNEIIASVPTDKHSTIHLEITNKTTHKKNHYNLKFDNNVAHLGESIRINR